MLPSGCQAPLSRSTIRHARRGCSPARFGATLQALCQSPRPRRHAEVFASRVEEIRAQQLPQEIPPAPRYSRRRFDPSSTTRSGEDNQTPIGSRSRWGQRGDVRDALDGSLWTALGAGNGPPSFLSRGIALLSGHRQTNRLYRRMRIGAAQQKFSWSSGERFLAPGYGCVPRAEWFCQYITTVLPNGAHFWYKGDDGL